VGTISSEFNNIPQNLPTELQLEIYKIQNVNHYKHSRTNTSATIEHESDARKGNKCNINPDAEFSKFKNVGTVNWMISKLSNNSRSASNEIITRRARQQDLKCGKGCELA